MRIAVAGSHATGKSTLVAALANRWPAHIGVEEAYRDADSASAELSVDFFEEQLIRCLELMRQPGLSDAIFDRTPLDYLAYLRVIAPTWDPSAYVPQVRDALDSLALVVFVPIESPDIIPVSADERPRLRKQVDQLLRKVLLEDAWGFGLEPCEVTGSVEERLAQVAACCGDATRQVPRIGRQTRYSSPRS